MKENRRHAANRFPDVDPTPAREGRETLLTIVLVAILGGAFVLFLNFVTFGLFFWIGVAVIGIVAVGYLHYVIWGEALSHEVADERAKQVDTEQPEAPDPLGNGHPRRF